MDFSPCSYGNTEINKNKTVVSLFVISILETFFKQSINTSEKFVFFKVRCKQFGAKFNLYLYPNRCIRKSNLNEFQLKQFV